MSLSSIAESVRPEAARSVSLVPRETLSMTPLIARMLFLTLDLFQI